MSESFAARAARVHQVAPGNRVRVSFDTYLGERGTVLSVAPRSGTLIVKLDRLAAPLSFGPNEVVRIDGY